MFPAGLSFIPLVTPESAHELLTARRQHLAQRLSERDALIASAGFPLPRATMLEAEYLHATTEAKIRWLDSVLAGVGRRLNLLESARNARSRRQAPGLTWVYGPSSHAISRRSQMSLRPRASLDDCRRRTEWW